MNAETWGRVERLTSEALELPPDEREAFVRAQCSGSRDDDSATLRNVLDLLAADQEMGDFLQTPVVDFAREQFGRYRVVREIGRGGMSVVYLGERSGADFDKQVAIKVLLQHAPGAIPESETRILASLEHPNIARLLDAGVAASGFRYLVMEYVDGVNCVEFARELNEEQRLRVFLQICSGVQHANRSLIIHRDLKPGNILVTKDGIVKLLDFGIAKILSPEADTTQTIGNRAYTIDYASPEQILGEPVTTATDVYSLGVLLCELVGGKRPRSLSTLPLVEAVSLIVKQEIKDVPLAGELALIARKALRRDPSLRYESAAAMAQDIERYLNNQPILAREPSWGYRAGKFIARNRVGASAATIAIAALATASGVAFWQARIAAERFDQVRGLSKAMMFDLHDAVRPLPGSLAARKLIVEQSLQYLDVLARDTRAPEGLQLEVARGYFRLADIQGTTNEGNMGNSVSALDLAEKGLAIARRMVAANPKSRQASHVLTDGLDRVSSTHSLQGSAAKAIPLAQEAVRTLEALTKLDPSDEKTRLRYLDSLHYLARAYEESREHRSKAEPLRLQLVKFHQELLNSSPADIEKQKLLGRAHQFMAAHYLMGRNLDAAEVQAKASYRINKALYEKSVEGAPMRLSVDVGHLANIAGQRKNTLEAIRLFQEQLVIRREVAAADPKNLQALRVVAATLTRLCYASVDAGKPLEAIPYGEEALQKVREVHKVDAKNGSVNRELFFALADLALAYDKAGKRPRVCPLLNEAARILDGPLKGKPLEPGVAERVRRMLAACPAV